MGNEIRYQKVTKENFDEISDAIVSLEKESSLSQEMIRDYRLLLQQKGKQITTIKELIEEQLKKECYQEDYYRQPLVMLKSMVEDPKQL